MRKIRPGLIFACSSNHSESHFSPPVPGHIAGYGVVIILSLLFLLPIPVYSLQNPINAMNMSDNDQIDVCLIQNGTEITPPNPVQCLSQKTLTSPVPSSAKKITVIQTIPSVVQPLVTPCEMSRAAAGFSLFPGTIPTMTASDLESAPGKDPQISVSANFSRNDSPQQEIVTDKKQVIVADSNGVQRYAADQVIVQFKSKSNGNYFVSSDTISRAHAKTGTKVKKDFSAQNLPGLQVVQLANGADVQSVIKEYESNPDVLYAEPDYIISISPDRIEPGTGDDSSLQIASTIPGDMYFSLLWGLRNTGQTGGTPGADISATSAWDLSTGSDQVIVAVVDTGVLYAHSDLSANIWTNPGEIAGNGIDDDHNGFIDDIHGWNFYSNTSDPLDDNGHGTHVSGTIGAVGNNGIGVTGVSWQVKIMALKAFDLEGNGFTSDAVSAIRYANANGASVISNSWNGLGGSTALQSAIDASPAVVVCAAGNFPQHPEPNNDIVPQYPSSYPSANIISVAATDQTDLLASFSHYGPVSVDLAAPGTNIYSTYYDGTYVFMSGTSMATPHVSGVAALVKSVNPSLTAIQIKNAILSTVDVKSSLSGKVNTSGRLNAYRAVLAGLPPPPVANFTGTPVIGTAPLTVVFTDLSTNVPTAWNWTFGDGSAVNATMQNPVHRYATGGLYTISLNATNAGGSNVSTQIGYINVINRSSRIAVFNNGNGMWSIDYNGNNLWDGAPLDKLAAFGTAGDIPVKGDWNNNSFEKIGVFRLPGFWILDANGNYMWDDPLTDRMFAFGSTGDQPVVGDWTRNGVTKIGLFRSPGVWILDANGNATWDGTPTDQIIGFGSVGDIPVVGDWNRDGHKEIGVFRSPGVWILDANGNAAWDGTPTDQIIGFGAVGDAPVEGDWNGDGLDEIGLYRNGIWILDYNANNAWDGPTVDRILAYSPNGGTIPITGIW